MAWHVGSPKPHTKERGRLAGTSPPSPGACVTNALSVSVKDSGSMPSPCPTTRATGKEDDVTAVVGDRTSPPGPLSARGEIAHPLCSARQVTKVVVTRPVAF